MIMDLETWYGEPNEIYLAEDGLSKWWISVPADQVQNLRGWRPDALTFKRNGSFDVQCLEPITIDGLWKAYCAVDKKLEAKSLDLGAAKNKYAQEHGNLMWEGLYTHIPELMRLKKICDSYADRRDQIFTELCTRLDQRVFGLESGKYLVHSYIHSSHYLEEKEGFDSLQID